MRKHVISFAAALTAFTIGAFAVGEAPASDGFVPIFDGKSLKDWDGDPTYWRVEEGKLVGEITPETLLQRNSWIIWRGGEVADFELKIEYHISDHGNSGVGYRCDEVQESVCFRGYQADIEGGNNWTGINYEERGRTFLALRGMKTVVQPGARPTVVSVFAGEEQLQAHVRKNEWNQYHLIVRGNRLQHFLNGVLMSEVVDLDPVNGRRKGLLGVQVHVGPPMTVEYRNILLKRLGALEEDASVPPEGVPELSFDNGSAMKHLRGQAGEH